MNLRVKLTVLFVLLGFDCRCCLASEAPNIVFILADDLGYMDVASYAAKVRRVPRSSTYYETPNLDRLVDEGAAFSQAYAHQLCSPTRASLLTGKNGARLGFTTATPDTPTYYSAGKEAPRGYHPLDVIRHADKIDAPQALINATSLTALPSGQPQDEGRDEVCLAEMLQGYRSAFVGKWHVGGHGAKGYQPQDQGFLPVAYFDAGGSPYFNWRQKWDQKSLVHETMPQDVLYRGKSGGSTGEDYLTDDLTEQATRFLRQAAKDPDQPFFLYFCHFAVHSPLQSREDYKTEFERKRSKGWNGHRNPAYAGMVKSLDDSVGAILRTLDELEIANDTIVFFMSDNGGVDWRTGRSDAPTSNSPFKGGKATLYEGGVRVPLVVRLPGGPRGAWIETPVFAVDLFPTIAELAGQDIRHEIDGQSFATLLNDRPDDDDAYRPQPFYWHYPFNVAVKHPDTGLPLTPQSAIRDGSYKLIFDWHGGLELYDIDSDPWEEHDLSTEMPGRTNAMFAQLSEWLDENIAERYLPAINKSYSPTEDERARPFQDLRHELLGHAPLE